MLLDLFLRLSPLQAVTHPSADLARFSWTSSAVPFSCGHPSHCRPNPLLLDLFLRLSLLPVVNHPSADPVQCCWASSSVVLFPVVTHPITDRARCSLTFFFDCLLFRRSPIQVPTWHGSPGFHLRLSRFPAVTNPAADLLDLLVLLELFLRLSPLQAVTYSSAVLARSPGLFLRLSRFPAVTDPIRCCFIFSSIVSSSGGHPSKCRPGPVLLDFIFGCPVFRRSLIPLPTEPGTA